MGPGAAVDAFLAEAAHSQAMVGSDGFVEPGRYDRVAVSVRDRAELRATRVPTGVRTAALAVWLDEGTSALSLVPRPEWPALTTIRSRHVDGGWLLVLRFAAPVPVHRVVEEAGRQAVWPDRSGRAGGLGLVLGSEGTDKVAADVRAGGLAGGEPDRGPLALGPLDERVLNPAGFRADADGPVVELADLDWGRGATAALVDRVRAARGVRVSLAGASPLRVARVVAGLAMAGVPLVVDPAAPLDPPVADYLGSSVADLLAPGSTVAADLGDPEAREAFSVVLRRAALATHATPAWRRRVAALAGVRVSGQPEVSVLLATRRADLLEHAVGQVARQRGVDRLELVLATHGYDVGSGADRDRGQQGGLARVRELAGPGVSVVLAPQPADVLFGDVLNRAAEAASGDVVVKMDDDDWYAPDFLADLLAARGYSGADLVGAPDDRYYLEPVDRTVRLGQPSELYRPFVAGGTMLLDRGLLREVGGFRAVRRHVDAQLIHAVRLAGGETYRAHGLGYVLRRAATGHTWQADLDDLQRRAVRMWEGFVPGPLMEL